MLPPEALGTILLASLIASGGCQQSLAFLDLQIPLTSAFVFTWPIPLCLCPKFPPLIRTPDTGFSESESHSVVSGSLSPHGLQPARLLSPWNSPGKNTGVGSQFSSPGDLPNPGFKADLLHCRQILHRLSHQENPGMLEWVAYHFSRGSSWPRNQAGVSCITGRFFTSWATREAWHWV